MNPLLNRRALLQHTAWLAASTALWTPARAAAASATPDATSTPTADTAPAALPARARLAAAWRSHGDTPACGVDCDQVGVLELDWQARQVRIVSSLPVAGRAHGLMAEPDGGFVAVATRPGLWLLRCDAQGRLQTRHSLAEETPLRTLGGHVIASADGQWLYTTETDRQDGSGWIGVRDRRTFQRVAAWPTHGLDPHQLTLDASGALLVLNGGIPRSADGRPVRLEAMDPSLVRLDTRTGERLGQWRLDDPRLSLRHLAWSLPSEPGDTPVLGIALQTQHEQPTERRDAPLLALWDGQQLRMANRVPAAAGYGGDIAPGPGGGFIVSGQRVGEGLLWHPDAPDRWTPIARLTEPCALASWPDRGGVLLAGTRGVGLWHPVHPPAMLPWPMAMLPDNHWIALA